MKARSERGVTLIELLVALVILAIVVVGVYQVYNHLNRQSTVQDQVAEMQQNVRVAIDQITRELRSAGYRYDSPMAGVLGSIAATSITLNTTTTNTVTIQGDYDDDGQADTITYQVQCLSTRTPCQPWLMRKYNNADFERFVPNITRVTFSFYDETNNPTHVNTPASLNPSTVRRVTVTLTGRTDQPDPTFASNDGYRLRTVTADVVLRNFDAQQGDVDPPACPTTLSAMALAPQCGTLQVTWSWAGTDKDLAGFTLYYTTGTITMIPPGPPTGANADYGILNIPDPTARSATLMGLKSGLHYNVIVESYDTFLNTSRCTSPVVSAIPSAGNPPQAPAVLVAPEEEMTDNQVTLRWNAVMQDVNGNPITIKGYRVYRSTDPNFTPDDAVNRIADEDTVNLTYFVDTTAASCTTYYYRIKAVDTCENVSRQSMRVEATPPDNKKAPGAPTIIKAAAGDDDMTVILDWTPATVNPSPVAGYRIYYGNTPGGPYNGTSAVPGMNSPITVSDPNQTHFEIRGLDKTKYYYIKIAAFDATCEDETLSSEAVVTPQSCSPRLFSPGGHYVFPDHAIANPPLNPPTIHANNDRIGLKSPDGNRYVTWAADPVDCDPDSTTFTRTGFDITPQPPNSNPNVTFKFARQNQDGSFTEFTADALYGSGPGGGMVPAPRNASTGYYHFPTWFSATDLDTTRFCNVRHDFIAIANDGEGNVSTSTLTLFVDNGGIELDTQVPVTTNISTPDDYHHRVRFGIKNTNSVQDLKITAMKLTWNNLNAFLKQILILDANDNVIGSVFPSPPAPSGTLITLSTVPTITANGGVANVDLTFSDISGGSLIPAFLEMRGLKISSAEFTVEDPLNPSLVCTAPLSTDIPQGPVMDAGSTRQDQPAPNTVPSQTPSTSPGSLVAPDRVVTISTVVNDTTGGPSYAVTSVKIYYAIEPFMDTTAPTRPSAAGNTSLDYPNVKSMILETVTGTNGLWAGSIGGVSNKRIWYYLEAFDANGNFDILPEVGAYTYAQCGSTPPSLAFVSPPTPFGGNVNGFQTIQVTASDAQGAGLQTVQFEVTGQVGVPLTNMTQVSPGVFEGSYNAGTGNLRHTVIVYATDVCNNTATITRTLN